MAREKVQNSVTGVPPFKCIKPIKPSVTFNKPIKSVLYLALNMIGLLKKKLDIDKFMKQPYTCNKHSIGNLSVHRIVCPVLKRCTGEFTR